MERRARWRRDVCAGGRCHIERGGVDRDGGAPCGVPSDHLLPGSECGSSAKDDASEGDWPSNFSSAEGFDYQEINGSEGDNEDEEEEGCRASDFSSSPHRTESAVATTLSEALVNDVKSLNDPEQASKEALVSSKTTGCCICGTAAVYTCPGCGRRTCSMTCVRVHKDDFQCSGVRDVAAKVSLSAFTDQQLQRDFHFLESCRRVVSNVERCFPRTTWRYNYKALPPPLHALREAARRRGVICQITSEGMSKRDANTSRLDRKSNTIIWRCEFHFYNANLGAVESTIGTDWGSERHRLGDILQYCWATNPSLLCYHINRQYNRASKYVEGSTSTSTRDGRNEGHLKPTPNDTTATTHSHDDVQRDSHLPKEAQVSPALVDSLAVVKDAADVSVEKLTRSTHVSSEPALCCEAELVTEQVEELPRLFASEEVPAMPSIEPATLQEVQQRDYVRSFLVRESYAILSKAERLGSVVKYFMLNPCDTLNENLRRLFFVNEFPVFLVVHASQLPNFALVTEEDKEAIRSSFRSTKRQESHERAPPRRRSDMDPQEIERLSHVPCRRFLQGRCHLGEECPYWHCTPPEIPACRTFLRTGQCDKGTRCSFRHDPDAVRVARKRQRDSIRGRGGGPSRGFGLGRGGRGFRSDRGSDAGRLLDRGSHGPRGNLE